MSMKKKKRVLNIVFVYLYLMYIGATFPVKAQSNYKVKLTGIVYEYDQNNKLLPLEFAAVSIPESSLGTTSNENVDTHWKMYLLVKFVCKFNI